jgi:alkylation response protein AidB-like acyl-CoA dehydrogenase
MTLLDYERSNISGAVALRRNLRQLIDAATSAEKDKAQISSARRNEIADRYIEAGVGENFSFRIVSMQAKGTLPNYEASMAKMYISEVGQRVARTGTKVFGLYSNLWDEDDALTPAKGLFTHSYVTTIPGTIAGGSSEIQRNIIATRGLGLPRG